MYKTITRGSITYVFISIVLALFILTAKSAQSAEISDVYAASLRVQIELDSLSKLLNKPKDKRAPLEVVNVLPREAYFEALSLRFRAKRLCRAEYAAEAYSATKVFSQGLIETQPPKVIKPKDIITVLDEAYNFISCVKIHKKITGKVPLPKVDKSKNLVDAITVMFQANHQLNVLLENLISHEDDCAIIDLAIQHVNHMITSLKPGWKSPKSTKAVEKKTIKDVYHSLFTAFTTIKNIEDISGIKHLEIKGGLVENPEAGDVFDMAMIIFAELKKLEDLLKLDESYNITLPKNVTTTQVYERAQLLVSNLGTLEKITKDNPSWLKGK